LSEIQHSLIFSVVQTRCLLILRLLVAHFCSQNMQNLFTSRVAYLPILKLFGKKSRTKRTVLPGRTRASQTFPLIFVSTHHMVIAHCCIYELLT